MILTVERVAVAVLVSGNAGLACYVGLRGLGLPAVPAAALVLWRAGRRNPHDQPQGALKEEPR